VHGFVHTLFQEQSMPTGYTAAVGDGTITDFTEYALQCARAFGACVTLRDEPLGSEIPEFEASDYNAKKLAEAEKALSDFLAMTEPERRELHAAEHTKNIEAAEQGIAQKTEQRERYEAMLEKAKLFRSPSPEHTEYATFLVSQLEESIGWDCDTSYYEKLQRPVPFAEWKSKKIKDLSRDFEYHTKGHQEELERTASRNKWVRQLKEALGIVSEVV
jgi:hypothetical protein